MPGHDLSVRIIRLALRSVDAIAVSVLQARKMGLRAMDGLGNEETQIFGDVQRSFVEHFVMECAESNAVGNLVWAPRLLPLDVRRFNTDWCSAHTKLQIKAADRTPVLVRLEYLRAKLRVSTF